MDCIAWSMLRSGGLVGIAAQTCETMTYAVLAAMLMLLCGSASAEVIDCAHSPGKGKWLYRPIDGRRCYFRANGLRRGKEKSREELRWPQPSNSKDDRGWSHKE
jgi:hypothetical protein